MNQVLLAVSGFSQCFSGAVVVYSDHMERTLPPPPTPPSGLVAHGEGLGRCKLPAGKHLQLVLPAKGDTVLSNPLVDGLGSDAQGAGKGTLIPEIRDGFCRTHAPNSTIFQSHSQLNSHQCLTDKIPLCFKLRSVEFSARLLAARTAAQKTQEQVAQACDISHGTISKAESGKTESMTADNLFAIADFLGCDARWLATGQGEMHSKGSAIDTLSDEQKAVVLAVIRSMK